LSSSILYMAMRATEVVDVSAGKPPIQYKNVADRLAEAKAQLTTKSIDTESSGGGGELILLLRSESLRELSKLESVASQTIELLTSDGGVQTENTALWTVGCQTATDTMAKGTQVEVPCLEARVGVARWTSIGGITSFGSGGDRRDWTVLNFGRKFVNYGEHSVGQCVGFLRGGPSADESHQVLATSERNCCHSQRVIHGLNKEVEELKASLMAAESRLKCRTRGVQTTRRLAVSSISSLGLEERMMTDRLAAVLGKAESIAHYCTVDTSSSAENGVLISRLYLGKMTANLIRSQSWSPPRRRMVMVTAPPPSRIAPKASSGNPWRLETVRTLREEIGKLRNEREQLTKDLAECREEKRVARVETSRRLADANE
ncbi:hypothetical protein FOZ63_005713, partial [Perkinsus olseni]